MWYIHVVVFIVLAVRSGLIMCQGFGTDCSGDPNICDAFSHLACTNGVCDCDTGYKRSQNQACLYDCGQLNIGDGSVVTSPGTVTGSVATYTCNQGYKLVGNESRTCQDSTGWDGSEPSCELGQIGDSCLNDQNLCSLIANAQCNGSTCVCNDGYEGAVGSTICRDIDHCAGGPCQNGGTCNDGVYNYTCDCPAGFTGDMCETSLCGYLDDVENGIMEQTGITFGHEATYTCVTGYYISSGNETRVCKGDSGWSGNEPVCTIRDCGDPSPDNGSAAHPGGTTYGDIALISCDEGFQLIGAALITCLANGSWSEVSFCSIKICSDPTPEHGISSAGSLTYTSSVTITCEQGYRLIGQGNITCRSDATWSSLPTCEIIDCGDPSPADGRSNISSGTTYNQTVTLWCDPGYDLHGSDVLLCLETGVWNDSSSCQIQDCGQPSVLNGTVTLLQGTTYGDVGIVSCDEGFLLASDASISCQAGPQWSSDPECNIRSCGDPTPLQGNVDSLTFTYDSSVKVSCNSGHTISGSDVITCQADGTWTDTPTCATNDCGNPIPPDGFALAAYNTTVGNTVNVVCNTGYTRTGSATLVCLDDGWNDTVSCDIQDCGTPSVPNGSVTLTTGTSYGAVAMVMCQEGFTLQTDTIITCLEGPVWSDNTSCLIKDCGDPTPLHGTSSDPDTTFGSVTNISCETGYQLSGPSQIQCLASGSWDSLPTCMIIDCGSPEPANGNVMTPYSTTYNQSVTIVCDEGYTLEGDAVLLCTETGWDGNVACNINDCGDPAPSHGTATALGGTTYGEVAIVNCDEGYTLKGSQFINCLANSSWSDSPTCQIVDCGDPTPLHGASSSPNTTFGSVTNISCETGYKFSGPSLIQCLASGSWDSLPTCVIIDCGSPVPANGNVMTPYSTTYNQSVTIVCDEGYALEGDAELLCNETGWDENVSCNINDCGDPTPSHGTATALGGTTYGEVAIVNCDEGYTLKGSQFINCLANSSWSDSPTCQINDCGDPTPLHGTSSHPDTTFSSVTNISCETGYQLSGPSQIQCLASGSWDFLPTCNIIDCGSPEPANGDVMTPYSTTYNQSVTIVCDEGYTLEGDAELLCTETGWDGNITCNINDCGDPSPDHGTAEASRGTTYGEVAIVNCDEGYTLEGSQLLTCLANSSWTDSPACLIKDCGDPTPLHGASSSPNTTFGSVTNISCETGYQLSGPSQIQCLASGSWDSLPTCVVNDCGDPTPENGNVSPPSADTTYGHNVSVQCDVGYDMFGPENLQCLETGWSANVSCVVKDCGDFSPMNGSVTTPYGTTYNSLAFVRCDTGFTLHGEEVITCTSMGNWSSEPECMTNDCGNLTNIANGAVSFSSTTYTSIATYTCNTGYYMASGSSTRTCQATAVWSGTEPSCAIQDCLMLQSPSNGIVQYSNGLAFGSIARFECSENFNLRGSSQLTCQDTGDWSDTAPYCDKKDDECSQCIAITIGVATAVAVCLLLFGSYCWFKQCKARKATIKPDKYVL